ncbi:glycosyltransferase [Phormidium sp. CCY1219]|uniref:glycosyltransferase n=1 Tax=Phormidium sp. CCY1219 TaxID=2886104 RepID=UPI002D1E7A01|nr:glycosyltransferase [Phormidium sp. CCY1219]MEB3827946.1 glycosyltransferase [Phormidium sp. CCY1219]
MRIAFIVTHFPALSETFILNQIVGLIERGHEVDIYADNPRNEAKIHPDVEKYKLLERTYYRAGLSPNLVKRWIKGVGLLLLNFYKNPVVLGRALNVTKYGDYSSSWLLPFAALHLFDKKPYDIVHCQFGSHGIKGALLKDIGLLQGKLVTSFRGFDLSKELPNLKDDFSRWLFPRGDLFLPVTEHWKNKLIELGCDENKIIVHRTGIDCDRFSFQPRQPSETGEIRLVTIGRFTEKKGIEYGIRAAAKLAKAYPNLRYTIVGDGWMRNRFERLTEQLGLQSQVDLLGWKQQAEIIEILNESHILLAPSVTSKDGDKEGIPGTLMEAMAMGLPVVSTYHSGIPELVENGRSGFLVPERDADSLAEKLEFLIQHPEQWPEMGEAGRKRVQEDYNIAKLNDRLVEIYKS